MLKDYVKSLKKNYGSLQHLPAESRLQLGLAYLKDRRADHTDAYREMLETVKRLNEKTSRNIEDRVSNLLDPIMRDLQTIWDEADK